MEGNNSYNADTLDEVQRLKAAVHFTVGRICEEVGEEKEVTFSKQFIAVLSETTFKTAQAMATDLELFARHGKRSTINNDDVKLFVRKSPGLHRYVSELAETQAAENDSKKKGKQKRSKVTAASLRDDSNT